MGNKYDSLSKELELKIEKDRGIDKNYAVRRRDNPHDKGTVWRNDFVRDVDKIMHSSYFNRYADKTQVFSFYKNDDLTRRFLHVQLVSRIARTIGETLNLNLDLIEAIALGHDIGHTPFGHAGEKFVDEIYFDKTGRHFQHNIHSARVLDSITPYNISLQTLNGIISHNGEIELSKYEPKPMNSFAEFDETVEKCYLDEKENLKLIPSTLEGCVVRICDIIAYIGKDRQDAMRAKVPLSPFSKTEIGTTNSEIINNLIVNIIENSYNKPYIKLDSEYFEALSTAKKQNYDYIYKCDSVSAEYNRDLKPMMNEIYEKLLSDLNNSVLSSPIFSHIKSVEENHYHQYRETPYHEDESNQIVVDFIASMTDDFFVDLYSYMFPKSTKKINYVGYFE